MFTSFCLFYLFSGLAIWSALFVITTKNPVFSILFLIASFANVSCFLFLFNFEFLPIAFLIIYVGAIAVLFLFVLMMLNIKLAELQEDYYCFLPISLFFGCVFIIELVFLFESEYTTLNIYNESSRYFLTEFLETTTKKVMFTQSFGVNPNLEIIAKCIFNDNLFSFIIAGYILLLALIAAIILTIQKSFVSKTQNVYSQILTDFNNTAINYK